MSDNLIFYIAALEGDGVTGPCRIDVAPDIDKRLTLMIMHCPPTVRLVHSETMTRDRARARMTETHIRLKDRRLGTSTWFDVTAENALSALRPVEGEIITGSALRVKSQGVKKHKKPSS